MFTHITCSHKLTKQIYWTHDFRAMLWVFDIFLKLDMCPLDRLGCPSFSTFVTKIFVLDGRVFNASGT